MGTRGTYGFRLNNKDYLMYKQFDSYPGGLGADIINFIKTSDCTKTIEQMKYLVNKLIIVNEGDLFTDEDKKKYNHLFQDVSTGKDWYSLLRSNQGDIEATLKTGICAINNEFIYYSLNCEYAYIINLDTEMFEFYDGYQVVPHNQGRYTEKKEDYEYYPCKLLLEVSLRDVLIDDNIVKRMIDLVEVEGDE